MPNGVYDNIYEDLDDSPVSWHITEVRCLEANIFSHLCKIITLLRCH